MYILGHQHLEEQADLEGEMLVFEALLNLLHVLESGEKFQPLIALK